MQLVTSSRSSSGSAPRSFLAVLRSHPAPQWALTLGLTLGGSVVLVLLATR